MISLASSLVTLGRSNVAAIATSYLCLCPRPVALRGVPLLDLAHLGQPDEISELAEAGHVAQDCGWGPGRGDLLQYPAHAGRRRQKRANREDDNAVTECAQPGKADRRRLAAFGPVEEQRHAGKSPNGFGRLRLAAYGLHAQALRAGRP